MWNIVFIMFLLLILGVYMLTLRSEPEHITYGMSFNTFYATELGLDWQVTYDAILNDLGVRHLRLAAHWPMIEPVRNTYNFVELDYQITRAEEKGADVILAVGRRLPRWPECHIPEWAEGLTWEEQKKEILEQIERVVTRYKESPAITYWQVENEPYLEVFARQHCGELDEAFLKEEIALVHSLDDRPVLVTDSGNLGLWAGAYRNGDVFGTSIYLYLWNPEVGQFRTILPPAWYRIKSNVMELLYGKKEIMLIELSAEPWLIEPIEEVSLTTQFERMDLEKFNDVLGYAHDSRLEKQYLWGAEWWYYLKERGYTDMWERGKVLFGE